MPTSRVFSPLAAAEVPDRLPFLPPAGHPDDQSDAEDAGHIRLGPQPRPTLQHAHPRVLPGGAARGVLPPRRHFDDSPPTLQRQQEAVGAPGLGKERREVWVLLRPGGGLVIISSGGRCGSSTQVRPSLADGGLERRRGAEGRRLHFRPSADRASGSSSASTRALPRPGPEPLEMNLVFEVQLLLPDQRP